MGFWTAIWTAISWFFNLFIVWLGLFISPLYKPVMLWIIIPIYINWIFTDFFQERRRTAMGNAITNGAVTLWVSIDWVRTLVGSMKAFSWIAILKFGLPFLVFIYGLIVIVEGIRGKDFVTKFGRVRETTYIMLMFTPIIYGVQALNFLNLLAVVVFFPVFYFLMEFVNLKILPMFGVEKIEERE